MNLSKIMLLFLAASASVYSQAAQATQTHNKETSYRYFVGSTLLMLGNFVPNDPNRPDFAQLNIGYRITPKHVVFLELKTSKFNWPLGMPWPELVDEQRQQHNFPGYVRQYIVGIAYNYFWWKGFYTGVHAMHAYQVYNNENSTQIATGYTLFLTYRIGYQFRFFDDRFFIEPSIGLTHWPIKTNTPEAFEQKEAQWPRYFGFEPGLHFGFNFNI
jgi:hypothetical protein